MISPASRVEPGAHVEGSVLCTTTSIGRGAIVRRAILDKNVDVPAGATSASTPSRTGSATTSATGIVVLGKGQLALP